jgi:hypothetical protein
MTSAGWIRAAAAAAWLWAAACGSRDTDRTPAPAPRAEPVPRAPGQPPRARPTTPDECRAAGGSFVPSIGGPVSCPQGQESLGPIRHGIEGGLCCK